MNKYQKLFINQAAEQLGRMLKPDARTDERTVYRMLHSIKGTSGTIGLQAWYEASLRLLEDFREEGERVFASGELKEALAELERLLEETGFGKNNAKDAGFGQDANSTDRIPEPPSLRNSLAKRIGGAAEVEAPDTGASANEREERRLPDIEDGVSEAEAAEGTVLLLDDDLGLLTLLKDELESRGFTVFATPRFDKAVEWFYEMRPDCAVLNVLMPEQSGFDLIERLRELCDRYMIPVVLMTAKTDDATRIRAYEDGADDFLTKPLNLEEFVVRIRRLIRRRRRLTSQLLLDQTTGAYGMPFLERELTRQIGLLEDRQERLAVAAVQLEGLRRLNERTGYREGDRLLRAFSDAVRRNLRLRDVWARDRANRFFLLQPGLSEAESAAFFEDILTKENLPELLGTDEVSAVCGIAEIGTGMSRQQALAGAVRALDAKSAGDARKTEEETDGPISRQLRLAIIDDDSLIRSILERQLQSLEEEYELEIRVFADGEEFFSDPWHAGGARYLLVLDRMMPRMNGMEVLTRLHGGGYDPVYTVLMLTGVDDERGIAEAIRAGTDDYVTKPFSMVELEARIRRLLGKVGAAL